MHKSNFQNRVEGLWESIRYMIWRIEHCGFRNGCLILSFVMRIKICRKESKESRYWLQLLSCDKGTEILRKNLVQESTELMKIFGAILEKTK